MFTSFIYECLIGFAYEKTECEPLFNERQIKTMRRYGWIK